jgi:hypothetical protein
LQILHGVEAPQCEGLVIEVHLDMMDAPAVFLNRLIARGFENDPFLDFYPLGFHFHYTGRTRSLPEDVHIALPPINELIADVMKDARNFGVRMYAECELVRDIHHFSGSVPSSESSVNLSALDGLPVSQCDKDQLPKADLHVEFKAGTVPAEVRALLLSRNFYWVRTPASDRFPSEEIATVQTSSFQDAQLIYERLIADPLPACTGIHLEQKLSMTRSSPDTPVPPVMQLDLANAR